MKITIDLTDEGIEWEVDEPLPEIGKGKWVDTPEGRVQAIVVDNAELFQNVTIELMVKK
jgi:hypothetical protein